MKRRQGFTLIELLVVIAIIAILAAILFPVFVSAKSATNKATCQASVRELLRAAALYENDMGDALCPGYLNVPGEARWLMKRCYPALLDRYVKQLQKMDASAADVTTDIRGVFRCPSAPEVWTRASGSTAAKRWPNLERNYGYNYRYFGGDPNTSYATEEEIQAAKLYHKQGEIAKPTKTVRLVEVWQHVPSIWETYRRGCGTMYVYPPSVTAYCRRDSVWPPGWHGGHSTVGWFDGHVTAVKLPLPLPDGQGSPPVSEADYVGIMEKGKGAADRDPWFRLAAPKP